MDDEIQAERAVELPTKVTDGRDELNLAEFPLSAISDRHAPDQKTMVFEDKVWDGSRKEVITRRLTITASDAYGLPTALDDEVILGLVQLSKLQKFADRKVHFTRYQLLKILGWSDEGRNYDRLEHSLNRWVGVTLIYHNAWWNKENQCWVNEKFHILDNVSIYDRSQRNVPGTQHALPLSSFVWNDVLFRSFSSGNLKSIDFDFFTSLESAVAKRLYRFLDKRFFHRARLEFDLKEVSFEHVGLSRNYDAANLKRKLRPAIAELERRGFLKPLKEEERFRRVGTGEWRVLFEKVDTREKITEDHADLREKSRSEEPLVKVLPESTGVAGANGLELALTTRGVSPSVAAELVLEFSADRIVGQLEVFDWLVEKKDSKVTRNSSGFLVASIRSEYAPPKGYVGREERQQKADAAAERKRKAEEKKQRDEQSRLAKEQAKEDAVSHFWQSLSPEERARAEAEALADVDLMKLELINQGGKFGETAKKLALEEYALRMMSQG